MLLTDFGTDALAAPYTQAFYDEAFALPADDLRATLLEVLDLQKGDRTAIKNMRKPQLARLIAQIAHKVRMTPETTKRPRKRVMTRVERGAFGTRKHRRMYKKARKFRSDPTNIHYKGKPAVIFEVRNG